MQRISRQHQDKTPSKTISFEQGLKAFFRFLHQEMHEDHIDGGDFYKDRGNDVVKISYPGIDRKIISDNGHKLVQYRIASEPPYYITLDEGGTLINMQIGSEPVEIINPHSRLTKEQRLHLGKLLQQELQNKPALSSNKIHHLDINATTTKLVFVTSAIKKSKSRKHTNQFHYQIINEEKSNPERLGFSQIKGKGQYATVRASSKYGRIDKNGLFTTYDTKAMTLKEASSQSELTSYEIEHRYTTVLHPNTKELIKTKNTAAAINLDRHSVDDVSLDKAILVMPDLGESIQVLHDTNRLRTLPQAIKDKMIFAITKAYDELNRKGLVHRDIKMANITYDFETETAHFVDLATAQPSLPQKSSDITGSALYLPTHKLSLKLIKDSPLKTNKMQNELFKLLRGKFIDTPAADMYGLVVIFDKILGGDSLEQREAVIHDFSNLVNENEKTFNNNANLAELALSLDKPKPHHSQYLDNEGKLKISLNIASVSESNRVFASEVYDQIVLKQRELQNHINICQTLYTAYQLDIEMLKAEEPAQGNKINIIKIDALTKQYQARIKAESLMINNILNDLKILMFAKPHEISLVRLNNIDADMGSNAPTPAYQSLLKKYATQTGGENATLKDASGLVNEVAAITNLTTHQPNETRSIIVERIDKSLRSLQKQLEAKREQVKISPLYTALKKDINSFAGHIVDKGKSPQSLSDEDKTRLSLMSQEIYALQNNDKLLNDHISTEYYRQHISTVIKTINLTLKPLLSAITSQNLSLEREQNIRVFIDEHKETYTITQNGNKIRSGKLSLDEESLGFKFSHPRDVKEEIVVKAIILQKEGLGKREGVANEKLAKNFEAIKDAQNCLRLLSICKALLQNINKLSNELDEIQNKAIILDNLKNDLYSHKFQNKTVKHIVKQWEKSSYVAADGSIQSVKETMDKKRGLTLTTHTRRLVNHITEDFGDTVLDESVSDAIFVTASNLSELLSKKPETICKLLATNHSSYIEKGMYFIDGEKIYLNHPIKKLKDSAQEKIYLIEGQSCSYYIRANPSLSKIVLEDVKTYSYNEHFALFGKLIVAHLGQSDFKQFPAGSKYIYDEEQSKMVHLSYPAVEKLTDDAGKTYYQIKNPASSQYVTLNAHGELINDTIEKHGHVNTVKLISPSTKDANEQALLSRFMMQQLKQHPKNPPICDNTLYTVKLDDGKKQDIILATPQGASLKEALLTDDQLTQVIRNICQALYNLQLKGFVHGNLNLDNIILKDAQVYFKHFGNNHTAFLGNKTDINAIKNILKELLHSRADDHPAKKLLTEHNKKDGTVFLENMIAGIPKPLSDEAVNTIKVIDAYLSNASSKKGFNFKTLHQNNMLKQLKNLIELHCNQDSNQKSIAEIIAIWEKSLTADHQGKVIVVKDAVQKTRSLLNFFHRDDSLYTFVQKLKSGNVNKYLKPITVPQVLAKKR